MLCILKQQVEPAAFGVLPCVVSERELIHIPLQVLFRREVVDADDAAFEDRPKALYCVRVNVASHVFA